MRARRAKKISDVDLAMNKTVTKIKSIRSFSLGTGFFPKHGPICFVPSLVHSVCSGTVSSEFTASETDDEEDILQDQGSERLHESSPQSCSPAGHVGRARQTRESSTSSSSYIRAGDLGLNADIRKSLEEQQPDGKHLDPNDCWIGLDSQEEGASETVTHSYHAPFVIKALATAGIKAAMDESIWTPERKTEKMLKQQQSPQNIQIQDHHGTPADKDVMIWMGHFRHGCYGHDIPAVKARGIVGMSPTSLTELLLDSDRVHLYNKISLGRTDVIVFSNDLNDNANKGQLGIGVTKIIRSRSKPPMVKMVELVSLIHARRLGPDDKCGDGYVIVTRAVDQLEATGAGGSEILMNVNMIRPVHGFPNKCEMINVNHVKSPGVPMMIAKKIGLSGASNFMNDLRALC